ncbi:MAG: chorismate mutase [Clostridia bacterium]|nr:chorismate mutase [Clostridia bacterium]
MLVRAARGAITVESNDANEIIQETKVLLSAILEENQLKIDEMISVIFTMTNDLNAAFPAVAARQIGWTSIPLMCMKEIEVPGSLEKCIRVLVQFNSEKGLDEIKHVYLKGAKVLRPDLSSGKE